MSAPLLEKTPPPSRPPPSKAYLNKQKQAVNSTASPSPGAAASLSPSAATSWAIINGERSFRGAVGACCFLSWARTPIALLVTLLVWWLPVAIAAPLVVLLPPLTFLLLTFGTMPKQWGDPYYGFVLWVQKLRLTTQFVQFNGARVEGRVAYDLRALKPKRELRKTPLPLGWGLVVADYREEEMDAAVILGNWFGETLSTTLIPVARVLDIVRLAAYHLPWGWRSAPRQTSFSAGENPVKFVMDEVGAVYPKIHQQWADKTGDEALAHFCRSGLAAHRVELAPEDCPYLDADGKPAKFVVRTNEMATLDVKEGCDRYGGDAYFGADWRPVAIVRKETPEQCEWWSTLVDKVYRPGDGYKWEYAKFAFRSTVFTLVTFVDHLFGLHMQTSELVMLATREQLSTDHPIRRFLIPFTFGAITINDWARTALCAYGGTTHRAFSFTDGGFARAWALAPALAFTRSNARWTEENPSPRGQESKGRAQPFRGVFRLKKAPTNEIADGETAASVAEKVFARTVGDSASERRSDDGDGDSDWIDAFLAHHGSAYPSGGVDTPFYRACERYHGIVARWVDAYCARYYPEGVAADDEAVAFLEQIMLTTSQSTVASYGLQLGAAFAASRGRPLRMRRLLVCFLTRFIELVTLGHEQVGAVQVYAQDASFASFSWKKGDLCGTKEAAMQGATLMCLTSSITPTLMPGDDSTFEQHDWSFLYPHPPGQQSATDAADLKALNRTFQEELAAMARDLDAEMAAAPAKAFPDNMGSCTVNPRYMECAVSI